MEQRSADVGIAVLITLGITVPILLCNLFGNTLVIIVLCKSKKFQSANTYLLGHLASSDLMFAIVAFIDIAIPRHFQTDAQFLPKYIMHALVSIYILTLLAVERYLAILKPFVHRKRVVKSLLKKIIIGFWFFASVLTAPGYYIYSVEEISLAGSATNYSQNYTLPWLGTAKAINAVALFTFGMLLPSIVMTVCYCQVIYHVWFNAEEENATSVTLTKSRRKLTKLFVAVTVIFFVTWTPSFGRLLVQDLGSMGFRQIYEPISSLLALLGSIANPVLYSLRSPRFRQEVRAKFAKYPCCKRRKLALKLTDPRSSRSYTVRETVSRSHRAVAPILISVQGKR